MAPWLLALLAAVTLLGCGGGGGASAPPEPQPTTLGLEPEILASTGAANVDLALASLWAGEGSASSGGTTAVGWSRTLPPIKSQGSLGSCVGWATTYYLRTSWEVRNRKGSFERYDDNVDRPFDPMYVYNQIRVGTGSDCSSGSYLSSAGKLLREKGAPFHDPDWVGATRCWTLPSSDQHISAACFKIKSWKWQGYSKKRLKSYLSKNGPVVLSIDVYPNFKTTGGAYLVTSGEISGGHAIACVGWDDDKYGGSFRLANSWGSWWADDGYAWVTYDVMKKICNGFMTMAWQPTKCFGVVGFPPPPTELDAPPDFKASNTDPSSLGSTFYVRLQWGTTTGAAGYEVQRRSAIGTWRTIASLGPDSRFHYDFGVEPGRSYDYRITALMDWEPRRLSPNWSSATGATRPVTITGGITLSASNPVGGSSFPDAIKLDWNLVSGDNWYLVQRADLTEGLRAGQYNTVEALHNATTYDDLVEPGSRFSYRIVAFQPDTRNQFGSSNVAIGATSGGLSGPDLAITHAEGQLQVERGGPALCFVDVENKSAGDVMAFAVTARFEAWYADGGYGLLYWADDAESEPILSLGTNSRLAPGATHAWGGTATVPSYLLFPHLGLADYAWHFTLTPLDAGGQALEDIWPADNQFFSDYRLMLQR